MEAEPTKAEPPKRKRRWFQFSLRTLLIVGSVVPLIILSSILALLCAGAEPPDVGKLLKEFSDERLDDARAAAIIEKLLDAKPADDEIAALAQVANSEKSSFIQRVLAIYVLIDRHIHAGMTARELGKTLHGATWMERLSVVRDVGGSIPTKLVEGETVFVVVIPEPGTRKKSGVGVYLRFPGDDLSADALVDAIHGKDSPLDKSKLSAIGFYPPTRELIKRIKARQAK